MSGADPLPPRRARRQPGAIWTGPVAAALLLAVALGLAAAAVRNRPRAVATVAPAVAFSAPEPVWAGLPLTPAGVADAVEAWRVAHRPVVRGLYMPAGVSSDPAWRERLVAFAQRGGFDAVVIDVKEAQGLVYYPSQVPLAVRDHLASGTIPDLPGFVRLLKARGFYTVARIVTFKDDLLALRHPEWAVHRRGGGIWRDRTGAAWMDPDQVDVWRYDAALAVEAARMGFDEVQFDYVRFPSDGDMADAVYAPPPVPGPRAAVVAAFLRFARRAVADSGTGALVSADVFGLVPSVADDMGIGQHWEDAAAAVDFISPMAYPSHYALGTFGLADPDGAPAATVARTMADACRRLPAWAAWVRPRLQDFSLRHRYGPAEVRAQVAAAQAGGAAGWLLWNPAASYTDLSAAGGPPPAGSPGPCAGPVVRPGPLPSERAEGVQPPQGVPPALAAPPSGAQEGRGLPPVELSGQNPGPTAP